MDLFSFPKPSASTEMKNLGFIDGTGEIVIDQTIYCRHFDEFNANGYCRIKMSDLVTNIIVDHDGQIFDLPENFSCNEAPDSFGLFSAIHRPDRKLNSAWVADPNEQFGQGLRYIGRTNHYVMRLDHTVAFERNASALGNGFYKWDVFDPDTKRHRYGIIDHTGQITAAPKYESIERSDTGQAFSVVKGRKFGVIDAFGNEIVEIRHPVTWPWDYSSTYDGVAAVLNSSTARCQVFDLKGVVERVNGKRGRTYFLKSDGSPAMRSGWGRQKYLPADIEISGAADGMIAFKKGGLWGYFDTAGALVIPPKYHSVSGFRSGLSRVFDSSEDEEAGQFRYIDRKGDTIAQNY